jgi:DNA mismatch repair protein MutS2
MNQSTINALEFDKIRKILCTFTSSPLGSKRACTILPGKVSEVIITNLQLVKECMTYFQAEGEMNFAGAEELVCTLDKAQAKGAVLEVIELLQLAEDIEIALHAKARIKKSTLPLPLMKKYADNIPDLRELLREIKSKIDSNGEILDSASQKLRIIRKNLRAAKKKIQTTLQSMLESQKWQNCLQEPLITIRNERFVLPIKAEHRSTVQGVVQDKSTSGATLFIEPLSVVSDNNKLTELRAEEKVEIINILSKLTERVRIESDLLRQIEEVIGELDLLSARAKFGLKLDCTIPLIKDGAELFLRDARHPLLDLRLRDNMVEAGIAPSFADRGQKQDVVPISLSLRQKENTMIITGPNTGGKTVALKTVGLLAMMSQSGLPIPASDMEMPVFQNIFADIGDQQSIVQNLSTFSAHLTNIIAMIKEIELPALVLLDEIGAGTDPSEGAALGLAIIDYFHRLESINIITTHHNAIKVYAYSKAGILNASVEFNEETLQPTYKLIQGLPGRSNAFKIAQKLGLQQELLALAETFRSNKDYQIDHFIKKLEEKYASLEQRENKFRDEEVISERKKQQLLQNLGRTLEREERVAEENIHQWRELKETFKTEAHALLDDLKQKIDSEELLKQARRQIESLARKYDNQIPEVKKKKIAKIRFPRYLFKGDVVKVISFNQTGTVCHDWDKRDNKEILLAIKKKKIWIKPEDTELISRGINEDSAKKFGRISINVDVKSGMSSEINLHGCTVEEAVSRADKFLDDAILAHLHQVRIVHGIGTGKLRSAITELLKNQPFVQNFRPAEPREGGEGVTIVELTA